MERIPMDWTEVFCDVDDFCQQFEPLWRARQIESGQRKRRRQRRMATSEIMTILIMFHSSNYRTFKHFYLMLQTRHREDFPKLVSYSRFVELMPSVLAPLSAYLQTRFGKSIGIAFIDSTALAVCKNKRISRNRVFAGIARRGALVQRFLRRPILSVTRCDTVCYHSLYHCGEAPCPRTEKRPRSRFLEAGIRKYGPPCCTSCLLPSTLRCTPAAGLRTVRINVFG